MKIRIIAVLLTLFALATLATTVVLADSINPAQLVQAGWDCINAGPDNYVHCFPPGAGASPRTISVRVFKTQDVNASEVEFLGTEQLIHVDTYNEQPCPQLNGPGGEQEAYEDLRLSPAPLPYFACHHYATGHHD